MNAKPASKGDSAVKRQEHPSPHRHRVSSWVVWFGLLGAPIAWSLQELINVSLSSQACYPHDVPLSMPLWAGLDSIVFGVEGVALIVCIAAIFAAFTTWQRTRGEKQGDAHQLLGGGDGRTRFMAMAGLMTGLLFLIGTVLATLYVAAVPACGG